MSGKILQINLNFTLSPEDLAKEFETAAEPISGVPGLKWKIFGMNEERAEGAGLYLFEDEASLQAYLNSPIIAAMKEKTAFKEINIKVFDVVTGATAITRGPV